MRKEPLHTNQGFSLVETLLAGSLLALLTGALMSALVVGQESATLAGARARAVDLAQEGLEAARNLRDAGFVNLTDGTHGLAISGGQWGLSGASDTTEGFTRQVAISTVDSNRKSITSNVTWQQNLQRTGAVTLTTRLANWLALGIGNWASPFSQASLNLAGNLSGRRIQIQGNYVYLIHSGGTDNFVIIDVTNPASPTLVATLTLAGTPQNLAVSGDYAYVASDSNSQELQIIEITTPATPTLIGTYNDTGNDNAQGIFVLGTTVYLVFDGGNEFVAINVSSPATPTLLGAMNLAGNAQELVVIGTTAYIASTDNNEELQVVDVGSASAPTQIGSLNLAGSDNGLAIVGFGSTVVLSRGGSGNVHVISVATPAAPVLQGTFTALSDVNDLSLGNNNQYVFLASDENSAEFRVLDITTPSAPVQLGFLNLAADINGIVYSASHDRAFAAGDDNSAEFIVLAPL